MNIPVNSSNDYHCANCYYTDFGFLQKGAQLGIYCSRCGRWLKWANKDERNLYEMYVQAIEEANGNVRNEYWRNLRDKRPYYVCYEYKAEIEDKLRTIEPDTAGGCGERENKWIPVTERLPEEFGKSYIVCLQNGAVEIATRMYDGRLAFICEHSVREPFDTNPIVAWMPLPEPYKAERNDEE